MSPILFVIPKDSYFNINSYYNLHYIATMHARELYIFVI